MTTTTTPVHPQYSVGTHGNQTAIMSQRGLICTLEAGYQQTREQDAAFIVQCVNSHAALVEALEALTEHSSGTNTAFFVKGTVKAMHAAMQGQKMLLDSARAALAQAKGRP